MGTDTTSGEMQSKAIHSGSDYYPYKVHIVLGTKIRVIAVGGDARVISKPIQEKVGGGDGGDEEKQLF
eukprot:1017178-Ditylum_brightwellii.AAC.1